MYLCFRLDRHCTLTAGFKTQTRHKQGPPPTGCSWQLLSPVPQPLPTRLGCQQPATAGQLGLMARKQPGTSKGHKEYVPAAHLVKPYRNTQSLLAAYALLTYFGHFQLKQIKQTEILSWTCLSQLNPSPLCQQWKKESCSFLIRPILYWQGKMKWRTLFTFEWGPPGKCLIVVP